MELSQHYTVFLLHRFLLLVNIGLRMEYSIYSYDKLLVTLIKYLLHINFFLIMITLCSMCELNIDSILILISSLYK